jgi:mannosyltransferase
MGASISYSPTGSSSGFRADRLADLLCLIAFLVSNGCKLALLDSRELWLDETYSAFIANLPFHELLRYTTGDVHPPLFYMLLWAWVRVVGDAQIQLRLFGVLLSVGSTVAMFFLAKRILVGARYGAFAAALFALSPMLFVYSLEVRMYMLSILVFICLLIVHWIVTVEQSGSKWLMVFYSFLAALLFYVHYIGIFLICGLLTHGMITSRFQRRRIGRVCVFSLMTLLLVSPGIPVLLHQRAGKNQLEIAKALSRRNPRALSFVAVQQAATTPIGLKTLPKSVAAMAGFYPAPSSLPLLICALPLVIAFAGVAFLLVAEGDEVCRLFAVVLFAVGAGIVAGHLYATRYMLPVVPLLVLALARAVQYWASKPRWRVPSLILGALVLALYAAGLFRQAFAHHGHPWQNLVSAVQQNYRPGDEIIFDVLYTQVPFDYFACQAHFHPREDGFPLSVYKWWGQQDFKGWGGPVILRSDVDRFVSNQSASRAKTVWLVLYETDYYDPRLALLAKLRQVGHVDEITLPSESDPAAAQDQPLRLIRVSAQ